MKSASASLACWIALAAICHIVICEPLPLAAQQSASQSQDAPRAEDTPTGKFITPTVAPDAVLQYLNPELVLAPEVRADGPASVAISPDGTRLAILAGGYNTFSDANGHTPPELATEFAFLFDITGPKPTQLQVFPVHASFWGLAWSPVSDRFYVSGGIDDTVLEFVRKGPKFVAGRSIHLQHKTWNGPDPQALAEHWGTDLLAKRIAYPACPGCLPEVGGLAVSPNGTRLLAVNSMNDSVTLVDAVRGQVIAEQDLRPGIINPAHHGEPGGSYPRAVIWTSPSRAYVASERDREVIALDVSRSRLRVVRRMPVHGQPVALTADRAGSRLYVALDTTNQVAVFDPGRGKLIETINAIAPDDVFDNSKMLGGANTNGLALTPDERTLLASNGGENAVAVIGLGDGALSSALRRSSSHRPQKDDDDESGRQKSRVLGLVPTGWYPSGVTAAKDGKTWYIVNGKTPTGPNVSWCKAVDPSDHLCRTGKGETDTGARNQHLEQLERAGLLSFPVPSSLSLAALTKQVAHNNHFDRPDKTAADQQLFAFLHDHIKHVIYIMKENLTYDSILGDLEVGNGDPRFAIFPDKITPNHHAIARNFVDLDNTLVSGEGSPQGWTWTYAAQTTDYNEWNEPHFYARRGISADEYGNNRAMNMGYATNKERHAESSVSPTDPDVLPGKHDVNAPDGPGGEEGKGYLWDAALRRGLTVRNYGMAPATMWGLAGPKGSLDGRMEFFHDPHALGKQVMWTTKTSLMPFTDPYFYSFNLRYSDYWRIREWKREFAEFSKSKSAPNLSIMWLANDHTGNFDTAIDGVNTPEAQVADNDYAVGTVVESVANSPFAKDTLIVVIEDDAFNGGDHVEAHRTVCLFAGAYVRQHTVVSTRYNTVSVVKTIEEILGMGPIGLNDALAEPMSDVFDPEQAEWTYEAIVPDVLRSTQLPLPPDEHARIAYPRHPAAYWSKAMADQDFSGPDRLTTAYGHELWRGLKGNKPYPALSQSRKDEDETR